MMVLIVILVLVIVLLGFLMIRPLLRRKFSCVSVQQFDRLSEIETPIIRAALYMARSDKALMPFSDDQSLYRDLALFKNKLIGNRRGRNYAYFNFPRAFLLMGLLAYGRNKNNTEVFEIVIEQAQKLIDPNGGLKFDFNKLDQALFGLLFIHLYRYTKEEKYKIAADQVFQMIQAFKGADGLYRYRKNLNVLFIDSLGMVVPFLQAYAGLKNDDAYSEEALHQIKAYWQYCGIDLVENNSFPCHAYDLEKNLRLGPTNWGRGIAWLMIGLSFMREESIECDRGFKVYWKKLEQISIHKGWPQFLGHTNDESIDASVTVMLYFSKWMTSGAYDHNLDKALKSAIDKKGYVIHNSGDTIYINRYSRIKGKSELSQGLLVYLLANN